MLLKDRLARAGLPEGACPSPNCSVAPFISTPRKPTRLTLGSSSSAAAPRERVVE
jgi:hypothetical protein